MGLCQSKIYIDDIELDEFENLKLMKEIKRKHLKRESIVKFKNQTIYELYIYELNRKK
jgi:hypothetical protein